MRRATSVMAWRNCGPFRSLETPPLPVGFQFPPARDDRMLPLQFPSFGREMIIVNRAIAGASQIDDGHSRVTREAGRL